MDYMLNYTSLTDRYIFMSFAVETSGVIGANSLHFLRRLGCMASQQSNNPQETEQLFQRISIAVLRGNCHAIRAAGHV